MANWICVRAEFSDSPLDWSPIHEIFASHGSGGTIEHGNPPSMSGYVYEDNESEKTLGSLTRALEHAGATTVVQDVVPEEDWSEAWKAFFKPLLIGNAFIVAPVWDVPDDTEGRELIVLELGQAFGTGDHPTTRMCISLLEQEVGPGATVCDIGTGSGILSIAAKKLGAAEVYATEVDQAASDVAAKNFQINQVDIALWTTGHIPEDIPECDVVVSNLVSAIIIQKAAAIAQIVDHGGVWIFSGVIPANLPDVQAAVEATGLAVHSWIREDGWVAGRFIRPE